MLKLRRLRVEKFRSVANRAELSFSDGVNVLLGQNGTGKTTLLDLISMVLRSDFSALAKEEFAVEYELSVSEGESLIVAVRNERVAPGQLQSPLDLGAREIFRPSAEVLGGADRRPLVRYDAERGLSVTGLPPTGPAGMISCLDPAFLWIFLTAVPNVGDRFARELPRAASVYRFDESLDLFRRATREQALMGDLLAPESGPWSPNPFWWPLVPDDLVKRLAASHGSRRPDHAFTHEDLRFLAVLKDMMEFSASELRVDVTERAPEGGLARHVQLDNLVFRFWWEDGALITHEHLSYGQKRLLAFFYYLACNPDVVVADELVNGLHHRWITASIEALEQRQAFLTSQNPLLLDYIPITSVEEVRRSFVLCRGEPRRGRPGWIWENMSADDARELFSAYEVGVEHVSEILQSRGLW